MSDQDVKRYHVKYGVRGWSVTPDLLAYPNEVEVVLADDYDRMEQAYQMMDKWFSDSMTQNQVDIIDAILNGDER